MVLFHLINPKTTLMLYLQTPECQRGGEKNQRLFSSTHALYRWKDRDLHHWVGQEDYSKCYCELVGGRIWKRTAEAQSRVVSTKSEHFSSCELAFIFMNIKCAKASIFFKKELPCIECLLQDKNSTFMVSFKITKILLSRPHFTSEYVKGQSGFIFVCS